MGQKFSIDVEIYADRLIESLDENYLIEIIIEEEGITSPEKFRELLKEEILIQASLNELEFEDQTLTGDQLDTIINKCIIKDSLDDLVDQGLIEQNFSPEEMDSIYSLKKDSGAENQEN
jgi:hypothetical protein